MTQVELGQYVRDTVTGFEGVATARTDFLFGCVRVCVQPRTTDEDDNPADAQWFDEPQLTVIGPGMEDHAVQTVAEQEDATERRSTGGPSRATGERSVSPGR